MRCGQPPPTTCRARAQMTVLLLDAHDRYLARLQACAQLWVESSLRHLVRSVLAFPFTTTWL